MANTKISALTAYTPALTTDILAVVDLTTGTTKKITLANLKVSLSLNSVENTALSTWAGTANITTLGTIVTGTWSGTAIALNKITALTASELVGSDASGFLVSLAVATYPSLTELTYVKGVTSAIQTQLNAKAAALSGTINEIAYFNSTTTIASLAVTTYPSLTELSYVKGVTSAIQTQFTGKAATDQTMYIGTTAVAINRASAALTLAGITLTTPNIGTPSAGVLTSCTGLPLTGLVSDTTTALGIGSINLGHATDTTIARVSAGVVSIEGVNIADVSSAQTLTTKTLIATSNVVEEITTIADSATPTPTGGSLRNFFTITALAQAATFAAPSGTPANGNYLTIRIRDNATARALSWNAIYEGSTDVALPSTTTVSKTIYLGFRYNSVAVKWQLLAKNNGFTN